MGRNPRQGHLVVGGAVESVGGCCCGALGMFQGTGFQGERLLGFWVL